MKNRFGTLLPALIFLSWSSQAQFTKGDLFVGGYLTFRSDYTVGQVTTPNISGNLNINPTGGFFINEKTAILALVGFGSSNVEYGTTIKYTSKGSSFSVGVGVRRFFEVSDKFYFAVDGGVIFRRGHGTSSAFEGTTTTSSEDSGYDIQIAARPLFVFYPSPRWGFEAGIGSINYTHSQDLSSPSSSNTVNLQGGNISFGIGYYFRKAGE